MSGHGKISLFSSTRKPDENGSSNQSNRQSPDHLTSPSAVPFALGQQRLLRPACSARANVANSLNCSIARIREATSEQANRHMMAVPITANAQRRSVAEEAKSTRFAMWDGTCLRPQATSSVQGRWEAEPEAAS